MAKTRSTTRRRRPEDDSRRRKRIVFKFSEGDFVDYKDVALLRKFMSDRGKIRSRRMTGLNEKRQRQVSTAIKNAREMALLPYLGERRKP
ncbi:MAG TPA: 30S ribosomal protein S18 [Acidimicrobiia bacterium]|nr:30S ribosomal protein S18 [Acidimicrobiia bacterium]